MWAFSSAFSSSPQALTSLLSASLRMPADMRSSHQHRIAEGVISRQHERLAEDMPTSSTLANQYKVRRQVHQAIKGKVSSRHAAEMLNKRELSREERAMNTYYL